MKQRRDTYRFACACCRRNWRLLRDERSRRWVELAEGWPGAAAPLPVLEEAHRQAWPAADVEIRTGVDIPDGKNPDVSLMADEPRLAMLGPVFERLEASRLAARAAAYTGRHIFEEVGRGRTPILSRIKRPWRPPSPASPRTQTGPEWKRMSLSRAPY